MTHQRPTTADTEVLSITPRNLYRKWLREEEIEIIDVRSPVSFAEAHVPNARSVPFETLDPHEVMVQREGAVNEPLYIICQIGVRSRDAARLFMEAGFTNVVNVEGGTRAWQEAGFPVVHERQRGWPLRRQVQLAAGSLIVAGSALGLFLNTVYIAIPVAVGAGLIYTAATDNCAMGIVLAKMPWNRPDKIVAAALSHRLPHRRQSGA